MKIGELSRATDTKVVTIRYYEQEGLLPKAGRTGSNYRTYGAEELSRLKFIRRCRDLGFSLEQVRALLKLSEEDERDCSEVDQLAKEHLAEISRKIADLKRLEKELKKLSSLCQHGGRIADCAIVESLGHT